jgi:hypothetical protein
LAYSLNDLYRGLRRVMRLDGVVVGGGGGLLLLAAPRELLATLGIFSGEPLWPLRLAGALLCALGVGLLMAAQPRIVSTASMVVMFLANGLTALVLLRGYLQGEFVGLNWVGQIGLVLLFLICLISTLVPLRYLRTDYVVL